MFIDFTDPQPGRGRRWTDLGDDDALLIWSLRRLLVAWPCCHAVRAALHRRFGSDACGIEHLLRCCLHALASAAVRPLRFGDPACALLLADEAALLAALAGDRAALNGLCDEARTLGPLLDTLSAALRASASASAAARPASETRARPDRAA